MVLRFQDVVRARAGLPLPKTPMWSYPVLDAALGATVFVKHENTQPTGAFKVRGGLTLLAGLGPVPGVVAYSTGNHAQSVAYAAREYGVPCVIVMPENPNPAKAAAVRGLGADLVEHGPDLAAAKAHAEELADTRGYRLVGVAHDEAVVAGVGTLYLEILEQEPDLEAIVVPAGSGSGAAAACLVASVVAPDCAVYAVQSSASPSAHDSWRAGELLAQPDRTTVEGLATGAAFPLPQSLMRAHLADFLLVDDSAIRAAQKLLLTAAHTLAEGAGAAATAAVLANPGVFRGRKIAVVCTGGNASEAELRAVLH